METLYIKNNNDFKNTIKKILLSQILNVLFLVATSNFKSQKNRNYIQTDI